MNEVLTVNDVAAELKLHRMTVYRLIDSGQLRAFHVTKKAIRVSREALEAYKRGVRK